jgi:hypothetical protein
MAKKKPVAKKETAVDPRATAVKVPLESTGMIPVNREQKLTIVEHAMAVNAEVKIDIDSLVRIPMRAFKDECEKNIRILTTKHGQLTTEANDLENEINASLLGNETLRKVIGSEEIDNFKTAFKAIGCECKRDSLTHVVDIDKAKVKFTAKLKYDNKPGKNVNHYNTNDISFDKVISAEEAGLVNQFTHLKDLRAAIKTTEEMATEWRRKFGTIHDVDDRLRCKLTETQIAQFEGGGQMIEALSQSLLAELKDLPRLEQSVE